MARPRTVQGCNLLPCPDRRLIFTTWTECTVLCDGGLSNRAISCLEGGNIGIPQRIPVEWCNTTELKEMVVTLGHEMDHLDNFTFMEVKECNTDPCPPYLLEYGSWARCSVGCGGGTQERVLVCLHLENRSVAPFENCDGWELPAVVQECNTNECLANTTGYSWQTTDWGPCSLPCGNGVRTRQVLCRNCDGIVDPTGEKCTIIPSEYIPTVDPCNTMACNWCENQFCSGNGVCDFESQQCQCFPSYSGTFCSISEECPSGLPDNGGTCCWSGVASKLGECCEGAAPGVVPVLDGEGLCCPSGAVDACGVCDGIGAYIDAVRLPPPARVIPWPQCRNIDRNAPQSPCFSGALRRYAALLALLVRAPAAPGPARRRRRRRPRKRASAERGVGRRSPLAHPCDRSVGSRVRG
eukprot:81573-Prorocentrum_minimum.AAC.2